MFRFFYAQLCFNCKIFLFLFYRSLYIFVTDIPLPSSISSMLEYESNLTCSDPTKTPVKSKNNVRNTAESCINARVNWTKATRTPAAHLAANPGSFNRDMTLESKIVFCCSMSASVMAKTQ